MKGVSFIEINSPDHREGGANSTPLELLQGCHARIRHFVQLGRTLASASAAPRVEISDAARALCNYFRQALPLHEADENESLFPRLRTLPPGNLVLEAAEAMLEQHRAIDELVAGLLSMYETLRQQPGQLPRLARRMGEVTDALAQIFAAHLTMEESVIFPALPVLFTPAQMAEVLNEMQERRRIDADAIHLVH